MVQYVQMVSKPPLGFTGRCFVKYDRASSAALAIENLNGVAVEGGQPLSVELAVPKGQTKDSLLDNEIPPHSRLFVTYLKTIAEEEFKAKFAAFPDVVEFKILRASGTGMARGIGYVKFTKSSSALRAMEEVNEAEVMNPTPGQPYRVKLAGPTGGTPTHTAGLGMTHLMARQGLQQFPAGPFGMVRPGPFGMVPSPRGAGFPFGMGGSDLSQWKNPALGNQRVDNNNPPGSRVWLSVSKQMAIEDVASIFLPYGFLESVHFMKGRNCGFAKYSSPLSAASACAALNGMEIAPGVVAKVVLANPQMEGVADPQSKRRRI
eukprot:GGOE01021351.1.p1 GENE.GGOE01021351.1~~GGOE01021351.1.p1  ORF type:complete len:363 (+),score=67.77 GGOE01021351.1:133-1089(+)